MEDKGSVGLIPSAEAVLLHYVAVLPLVPDIMARNRNAMILIFRNAGARPLQT